MTHAGGMGSNPGVPELWRLVTLKPLKLQQCTLHFWKPQIFFYLNKRGKEHSCMFICDMLSEIPIGLLHEIAFDWFILSTAVSLRKVSETSITVEFGFSLVLTLLAPG